jgi:hypothetical protein
VVDGWCFVEQVGNEWRSHVVGQVCNDMPVLAARLQWCPIQEQRITVNDLDIWQVFNDTAQYFDNTVIYFNRNDGRTGFGKRKSERTEARTNFEHKVAWAYACESRDASHSVGVDYKVLTKRATR